MEFNLTTWKDFKSYLLNRKQFILYEDFKTEMKIVKSSALQGSMLGPLSFVIFVNDLKKLAKLIDPLLLAEDTNLFCSSNNMRILFEMANQKLNQIKDWLLANKLSLNIVKTKYMLFLKLRVQDNTPLTLRCLVVTKRTHILQQICS